MEARRLVIFTIILIFILVIGSKYVFMESSKTQESHSQQRPIERQLSLPSNTTFHQTQIKNNAVINNATSLKQIKENYQAKFEDLKNETDKKIDSLFAKAHAEFASQIKDGETLSIKDLYQKYSEEGKKLEQETDKAFESLYNEFIQELNKNGYSEQNAEEFKQTFNQQKEERKSDLLLKALAIVRQ